MAKSKERLLARQMRKNGYSVKTISRELLVSRSSVSIWVRDIILTPKQLRQLNQNSIDGRNKGRTTTSLIYQKRREKIRLDSLHYAQKIIGKLSSKEFLILGTALYWAEGNKKSHAVRFTNSDPNLIKFAINWFTQCFNVTPERFGAFVGINESHRKRERKVIEYWSAVSGIHPNQFRKTIFKKAINKKVYDNPNAHFGTLTIYVLKPIRIYNRIIGLINALSLIINNSKQSANVAQR